MAFRVEFSEQADRDLNDLFGWLQAQHAGEAGLRWFLKLQDGCESLDTMPQRCSLAPESEEFPFEVRQLIYGRKPHFYRVLFTIEGETVVILNVRHGRRLPLRI